MNGLIDFWIEKHYRDSKLEGKPDRKISRELGISERTLRRKKKGFNL